MCDKQAELFRVFGVGSRIRIIDLLKERGPLGAKEIAKVLQMTLPAVSQHLKILKQAGLVRNQRIGYWIPYEVNPAALEECRQLISEVCTCGCNDSCASIGQTVDAQNQIDDELVRLKKYETELEEELARVRARVSMVEKKG